MPTFESHFPAETRFRRAERRRRATCNFCHLRKRLRVDNTLEPHFNRHTGDECRGSGTTRYTDARGGQ
jgi:hypothetical protein